MVKVIVPMLAAVLVGCASYGTPLDTSKIEAIQRGVTTKADIARDFGAPHASAKRADGTEVITWSHAKTGLTAARYQVQSITVTFAADGTVSDYIASDTGMSR